RCEAIVTGAEDFYVTVEQADHQTLKATCSCPSLASYTKDCQHVAAVLLAIQHEQRKGTAPGKAFESRENQALADDLVKIFDNHSIRSSAH
ncbi:SWIM zinc finger family protein, partial [Staphylococcus sp. SIMBA_130]